MTFTNPEDVLPWYFNIKFIPLWNKENPIVAFNTITKNKKNIVTLNITILNAGNDFGVNWGF